MRLTFTFYVQIFDITDDSVLLRCSVASQGLLEVIWVDESTIRAFYLVNISFHSRHTSSDLSVLQMEIISYKIPPVSSNVSSEPLEVVAVCVFLQIQSYAC